MASADNKIQVNPGRCCGSVSKRRLQKSQPRSNCSSSHVLGKSLALQKSHFTQGTQLLQPGKDENSSWAAPRGKACLVPFARKGMDYSHLSQPKNKASIINRAEKAMSDSMPNSSWGQAATTLCEPRLVPWPEAAVCTGTGRTATSATAPLHQRPAFKCTHPASEIQSWTALRMKDTSAQGHVSSWWGFTAGTRVTTPSLCPRDRRLPSVTGRQWPSSTCWGVGWGGVTSSPKTFCLFCLVFHVMEL